MAEHTARRRGPRPDIRKCLLSIPEHPRTSKLTTCSPLAIRTDGLGRNGIVDLLLSRCGLCSMTASGLSRLWNMPRATAAFEPPV